jgi:hypothetical protein
MLELEYFAIENYHIDNCGGEILTKQGISHSFVDIFEGIDPRHRLQAVKSMDEVKYFPIANLFESCNSIQFFYYIVWEVSRKEVLVETLRKEQFEFFENLDPKMIWLKGSYKYKHNLMKTTFDTSTTNKFSTTSTNEILSSLVVQKNDHDESVKEVIDLENNDNFPKTIDYKISSDSSDLNSGLPQDRLEAEAKMAAHLDVLYDQPLTYAYREISVGGETKRVHAFHYPAENIVAPKNNSQKREYIDDQEECILYRWELKAVLCCKLFYNKVL